MEEHCPPHDQTDDPKAHPDESCAVALAERDVPAYESGGTEQYDQQRRRDARRYQGQESEHPTEEHHVRRLRDFDRRRSVRESGCPVFCQPFLAKLVRLPRRVDYDEKAESHRIENAPYPERRDPGPPQLPCIYQEV